MFYVSVPHRAARLHAAVVDDTFERFFGHAAPAAAETSATRAPVVDVVEAESAYTVTAELPGIGKDDVKVSIDGRKVVIAAEVKVAEDAPDPASNGKLIRRERSTSRWSRTFNMPVDVDASSSSASMDNGVLKVVLTKKVAPAALQLAIN